MLLGYIYKSKTIKWPGTVSLTVYFVKLFTCVLASYYPQCKDHMCLLLTRIDSYFEVRILQSHMLADLPSLSNACKVLAQHYHMLKYVFYLVWRQKTNYTAKKCYLPSQYSSRMSPNTSKNLTLLVSWENNGNNAFSVKKKTWIDMKLSILSLKYNCKLLMNFFPIHIRR